MRHVLLVAIALLSAALVVGVSNSQDTKKLKGMLPSGWKALDLTPAQKEKVYGIQAMYKEKIAAIEKQLEELRGQQSAEMVNVLTEPQKEKLRKLLLGGLGAELKKE